MEFLYKMYENQNFALILFLIIAVLLVLFIVVLLAALHDTKKRKIAELDEKEKQDIATLGMQATMNTNPTATDTQAFTTEEASQSLDFFANEEEQSKTRDITFTNPTTENSMNGLLEEFEEPKSDVDVVTDNGVSLQEVVPNDSVVQTIETPVPEVTIVDPVTELPTEKIAEVQEPKADQEIDFAALVEQETKELNDEKTILKEPDQFSSVYVEEKEAENDLELPAVKEEQPEMPKEATSSINLEKTGVLDFGNIESESYDIKS